MSDHLLLDDRLAPMTSNLGFVEAPIDVLVEVFMRWQESTRARFGASYTQRTVTGDLQQLLGTLLPLTTHERRRFLFLPTADPKWTAYFDNGPLGSSAPTTLVGLALVAGLRSVRATLIPNSGRDSQPGGRYGANVFEVYAESPAHPDGIERSIELINDGGRWRFSEDGPPLPFEDVSAYRARRAKDRFPPALLERYLSELGIRAFEDSFYAPDRCGVLVEKQGREVKDIQHLTLAEARAGW